MQRGLLNPRGGPEPSHTGTPDAGIRYLDIVRSKARKLSPSGERSTQSLVGCWLKFSASCDKQAVKSLVLN